MKTIYFVRHGQTEFNRQKRLQGWNDSPLSKEGEQQVLALAQALKPLGIRNALTSPLGRAQQTAKLIQSVTGIDFVPIDELKEVSFGAFEGNTLDQLEVHFPGQWTLRQANKWDYRPPDGEANKDAVPRAESVVRRIEEWERPEPLLIIAHFAINRIILSLLSGLKPADTVCMSVPHTVVYRTQKMNGAWNLGYRNITEDQDFQPGWIVQEDPTRPMGG